MYKIRYIHEIYLEEIDCMAINQLKTGAILNYVVLGLNALVGLAYTPFMLRMLGKSEYGLFALAASVIAYLSMLDLGFGNAVIRYTAKFRAEGKTEEQYYMFGMFTMLYSVLGFIVLFAGVLLYQHLDSIFGQSLTIAELGKARVIVLLMVFNLAVTFPLSIYGAIISAYENFIFLRLVQIARILLNTAVMIVLLSYGYKAIAMVVVQTAFNIITLLLNVVYCRRKINIKVKFGKVDKRLLKEVSIYSFWIFLNTIMDRIYWSTGQFVLGAMVGTVAVAVFAVAIQLQGMYMMFSTAIVGVFLPRVTAMVTKNNDKKELSDLFIRTGRVQYIVMAFILSGFIVFGKYFIHFWAGDGYDDAYTIALLFLVPLTIPLIQNLGITILQARNQMRFRSEVYVVIALVSLGFQIPLAKYYGGIGCAMAIAGALTLGQIIVMNIYYHKKQGLNIIGFWKEIIQMSIVPFLLCTAAICVLHYYPIHTFKNMCLGILIFTALYLPLFMKLSMNRYERTLVLAPIKKIFLRND